MRRRWVALVVVVAVALAACGGDDGDDSASSDATTTTAAATTTAAPDGDASSTTAADGSSTTTDGGDAGSSSEDCPYLTAEALADATGEDVTLSAVGDGGCVFEVGETTVDVSPTEIQIDPEEYADESLSSCEEGTVVDVDAGDRAYACIALGAYGAYYEGTTLISLSVLFSDDDQDPALRDAFAEVLPEVTVP